MPSLRSNGVPDARRGLSITSAQSELVASSNLTWVPAAAYAFLMRRASFVLFAFLAGCGGAAVAAPVAPTRVVAEAPPEPVEVSEPLIQRAALAEVV